MSVEPTLINRAVAGRCSTCPGNLTAIIYELFVWEYGMRKVSISMALAFLAGCGGGGGAGSSSGQSSQPTVAGYFNSTPINLPDVSSSVANLCGSSFTPFVSLVTPIDLNNDGRPDLVLHLWCNTSSGGTLNTQTPDQLFALLQAQDGTFVNGNQLIFGQANVSIGGASRKVATGDFNGDGYLDLSYAVNEEDGRAISGNGANQAARPVVVLSRGNAQYQVMQLGTADWLHTVTVADNEVGGLDVLFQGFNGVGVQAFRYVSNVFSAITIYPPTLSAFTFNFFPRLSTNTSSQKAISAGNTNNSLDLYIKNSGNWSVANTYSIPLGQQVPYLTWQQNLTTTNLMSFAGYDLIGTAINETCLVKLSPNVAPIVIANLNGSLLPGGYQGGTVSESGLNVFNGLIGLDTAGDTFTHLSSLFTNLETNYTGNSFDCKDINGDGYQDVAVYPNRNGGTPILYVNNKQSQLVHYDTSSFPTAPTSFGSASSLLYDFNGDGVKDLLYFPKNFSSNGSNAFKLHTGNRNLD